MNELPTALVLVAALLVAIYIFHRIAAINGAAPATTPPPGKSPGTLRLGQYAVQPGAQWLVLRPGDM